VTPKAKVKTSLSDIVKVTDGEAEKRAESPGDQRFLREKVEELPPQLNVIGLTVEDALPKVDKFIDQALLYGLEKVRIIHGVGSGRLRSAIGKYLNGHPGVKQVTPGDGMKGGQGVTLVELL